MKKTDPKRLVCGRCGVKMTQLVFRGFSLCPQCLPFSGRSRKIRDKRNRKIEDGRRAWEALNSI